MRLVGIVCVCVCVCVCAHVDLLIQYKLRLMRFTGLPGTHLECVCTPLKYTFSIFFIRITV